jgi:ElaA protein
VSGVGVGEVRVARFEELEPRTAYHLWQLRESVFVVEQTCPYPELDGRDLEPGTRHLWIEQSGAPVGYLRVLDDGDRARIGRVLVAPSHRRRGLADTLMRAALEEAGDRGVCLDAQSYLADWYARFGFEQVGPEFLEDGIAHVPMRRQPGTAP